MLMLRGICGFVVTLAFAACLLPGTALAQTVYESRPTSNFTTLNDGGYLARVQVATPFEITAVGQETRAFGPTNVRFIVHNDTTNTFLYVSPTKSVPDDAGAYTFKQSDPFPAITLVPGNTYSIGVMTQGTFGQQYAGANAVAPQNGVTQIGYRLFQTFGTPVAGASGTQSFSLRLVRAAPVSVPTLSESAMILFGLILAGGAALYVQRRQITI